MRVVVTAGPTREHLDPVRFLSNPSTGKMGFAIAAEAARRGHEVVLIAGPVALKTPKGVERVDVVSAREMMERCLESLGGLGGLGSLGGLEGNNKRTTTRETVLIATAAVADWRPAKCATKKLKKGEMASTLKLVRNPDILKTISKLSKPSKPSKPPKLPKPPKPSKPSKPPKLSLVGFAAETDHVLKEAARKCREKGLEFIVANDVTQQGSGFGTDTNKVTFVFPDGRLRKFPLMTKRMVAKRILEEIENEK